MVAGQKDGISEEFIHSTFAVFLAHVLKRIKHLPFAKPPSIQNKIQTKLGKKRKVQT